jgi:hypothetical protein
MFELKAELLQIQWDKIQEIKKDTEEHIDWLRELRDQEVNSPMGSVYDARMSDVYDYLEEIKQCEKDVEDKLIEMGAKGWVSS